MVFQRVHILFMGAEILVTGGFCFRQFGFEKDYLCSGSNYEYGNGAYTGHKFGKHQPYDNTQDDADIVADFFFP